MSSTDCKTAQAKLKLQGHGNMQNKHIVVLLKASVQERASRSTAINDIAFK